MKIIFHGHACTEIQTTGAKIIIDPWLRENPLSDISPEHITPAYILLTHGHYDHFGDTVEIALSCGSTVIAPSELAKFCSSQGLRAIVMNQGGWLTLPGIRIKMVRADHSSSIKSPDGNIYAGLAAGYIIEADGKKVYHAGDTALFSDMSLIGSCGLDAALLPIGDTVTMGAEDAAEAARLLKARIVIPIHYNSFPAICCNPEEFKELMRYRTPDCECRILSPGDQLTL